MFEIGSSLRDARVRQGLDLTQLEFDTKIRAKYLKALEEEEFGLLPGDAYVKGFLRTYAERLGLDGQLYVDEYNSRFSLSEEPVSAARPRRRSRRSRLEAHAVLIALAGIVAVTVLVIAAWQLSSDGGGAPAETTATPPAPPVTVPETTEPATTEPATEEPPEEPAVVPAPQAELLVAAVRGPSRVEVRRGSAGGELLFKGTIAEGTSELFAGKILWVKVGKPQNVELELNGEEVHLAGAGPAVLLATVDGVTPADAP